MIRSALIIALLLLCSIALAQDAGPQYETKSIFFGGGNWYVDPQQKQELLDWIDAVPNLEEYEIVIQSHTDNIGSLEYNQWLSQMRSESVFQILNAHEIPAEWLFIRDYGELNPDFDNNTYQGRLHNRRVDVILIPPAS
ncbi:MAG: OmpA family protein [Saprospiraceae bacterium]|nr:OmpA family protein [Saprospiraceae bacterium]